MRRGGEQMLPERSEDKWYQKFCRNMKPGNVCATNDTRWSQETPGEKKSKRTGEQYRNCERHAKKFRSKKKKMRRERKLEIVPERSRNVR